MEENPQPFNCVVRRNMMTAANRRWNGGLMRHPLNGKDHIHGPSVWYDNNLVVIMEAMTSSIKAMGRKGSSIKPSVKVTMGLPPSPPFTPPKLQGIPNIPKA